MAKKRRRSKVKVRRGQKLDIQGPAYVRFSRRGTATIVYREGKRDLDSGDKPSQ